MLAVGLSRLGSSSSPSSSATEPVPVASIPSDPATVEPCAQVLSQLPVQLTNLNPRIVHQTQAAAWGNPPIVLRCGVGRPAALTPTAETVDVDGVFFVYMTSKTQTVYTAIDRSVYVEVTIPAKQDDVLPPLADAIAAALPHPACAVGTPQPPLPLCTQRQ